MRCAVELKGVSKSFVMRRNPALNLKERLVGLVNARYREQREEFWALRDVNLEIREGEFLGVVGPNGSGKSTLLRIIAGIYFPTRGEVAVQGRVAPMIELGVGFHPDLTGRENVYLNASLFSLSKRETDEIYQQIVEFSELERFIDVPVKNYSTGMYMRLGFAVAVHLDPDVLLIDEVLAVGDDAFQEKCIRRMEEIRARGKTIVLVSHRLAIVERMCDRASLLFGGRLIGEGPPRGVVEQYREMLPAAADREGVRPRRRM